MWARGSTIDEGALSVIVKAGAFRCALEARAVECLDPLSRLGAQSAAREVVHLAALLGLPPAGPPRAVVALRKRAQALLVQEVEAVRDLRSARFLALPVLTRLDRPAFRGVYALDDGSLLPVLDVDGLLGPQEGVAP